MGLDIHSVRFLLRAHKQGVHFGKVLTVGRLRLDVFPEKVCQLLQEHSLPNEPFKAKAPVCEYAEEFFRCLGATQVDTLDASDYEGATLVHDLNQPIPPDWRSRYDIVCDGGTLEHVFNFPVALQNCMELVHVGGHLFIDSPANNYFGHGFYQFSPELFYSALSEENGYKVTEMIAHPAGPQAVWYRVANPKMIRSRVELISYSLIHLLVQAQRTKEVEIFQQAPMQSDYTVMWQETDGASSISADRPNTLVRVMSKSFPAVAHFVKALGTAWNFYRCHSLRNRRFFTPIEKK
jgi:hypothetical protein